MELLLKRKEIGRNKYDLFAKLELTPEEEARMRKADTRNTYVWEPDFVWVFCIYRKPYTGTTEDHRVNLSTKLICGPMRPDEPAKDCAFSQAGP